MSCLCVFKRVQGNSGSLISNLLRVLLVLVHICGFFFFNRGVTVCMMKTVNFWTE